MKNKKNKERIKKLMNEFAEPMTTSEILTLLKETPSISGRRRGGKVNYKRNTRWDIPTMTQLGMLLRPIAEKHGFCKETKQTIWKLKEEYENAMDRKIPAQ